MTTPGRRATPERRATADPHAIAAATPPVCDAAEGELETGPLRRCVVTRARLPKDQMIRFVVGPDRRLVPDLAASLPGRGIWLSASADVIEHARTRGAFARAARGPVAVPPDLAHGLRLALARRIGETLGLARRAGQAIAGFAKAREWVAGGRAALVVQASDGSAAERARFLGGNAGRIPVLAPLDGATLGAIFGREHVVHVAVAPGRLADRLTVEAARLAGLRMTTPRPDATGARRRDRNSPSGAAGGVGDPASPDEKAPVPPDGERPGLAGREAFRLLPDGEQGAGE